MFIKHFYGLSSILPDLDNSFNGSLVFAFPSGSLRHGMLWHEKDAISVENKSWLLGLPPDQLRVINGGNSVTAKVGVKI